MEIITESILTSGKDKQPVNGIVLIKETKVLPTSKGTNYVAGKLQSGVTMDFKSWGNSAAFKSFSESDFTLTPAYIDGEFNLYNGTLSIIVNSVTAVSGYEPVDFFPIVYDKAAYTDALIRICKKNLTDKGFALADKMLFSNSNLWERFSMEFAAAYNHDNCKNGLLAHTYKVIHLLNCMSGLYADLFAEADTKDLIFLGALLHDTGKTQEMEYGVYQPDTACTHRILGLDLIFEFKDDILKSYDLGFFRKLESIFVQHHGNYEDPCRTVVSYVVHQADCLDARMTKLIQDINTRAVDSSAGSYVRVSDKRPDEYMVFI